MNFYKHHIGDYAQATLHLSFVEDAAYSRLLRKYYAEEKPLPADLKAIQRLVGARSEEERDAVETVLSEFFVLQEDGWHNKRADEEIAKALAQAETNRKIAVEREERKRARKENEAKTKQSRTEHESCEEGNESCSSREPSQTPDSRLQTITTPPNGGVVTRTPTHGADGPPRTSGTSIPIEDWRPHPETIAALETIHGIPPDFIAAEAVEFRAYWRDRGDCKTSWDSAFLNRVPGEWRLKGGTWGQQPQRRMGLIESLTDTSWAEGLA